jgi:hypothetical protein
MGGFLALALALASAEAATREAAARPICPTGYALLGKICISDSGDIVLPLSASASASPLMRAGQ